MDFYWQQARDSLLTPTALQIFQIACTHDNQDFDRAKQEIDAEHASITGNSSNRHGGLFQTSVQVFQEAGWIQVDDGVLRITPTGRQARELLIAVPDFLHAAPYFLIELLARYQLNNPAKPEIRKGAIAEQLEQTDVFPYWTIWKIMRGCNNLLTTKELRRFVLRLERADDIDRCINQIMAFRADVERGLSQEQLDDRYPEPLPGAVGEPKYIMARAGTHIGKLPSLIEKPSPDSYKLNAAYIPFIDRVLANEPIFKDHLTANSWIADYSRPVTIDEEYIPFVPPIDTTHVRESELPDEDPVYTQVRDLMSDGALNFMLSGPPGTSKSWYARQIAHKLTGGDSSRIKLIQFHPSYGYEDFVEGYVPQPGMGDNPPSFQLIYKALALAAKQSAKGETVVLIIDEFTRGDAGRIFGEVLTYIEPEYRDQWFTLASGRSLMIPKSLHILATMNPYDRSVTDVDVAMQRRFEIISLRPDEAILRKLLLANDMEADLVEKVVGFFRSCQNVLPFGGLGHVYFLRARDTESLNRIWKYKLEPLFVQELRYEEGILDQLRAEFALVVEG